MQGEKSASLSCSSSTSSNNAVIDNGCENIHNLGDNEYMISSTTNNSGSHPIDDQRRKRKAIDGQIGFCEYHPGESSSTWVPPPPPALTENSSVFAAGTVITRRPSFNNNTVEILSFVPAMSHTSGHLWTPPSYRNNNLSSLDNQRRLSQQLRLRSLFSSIATNQRAAAPSSVVPPAALDEQHVLQSNNTSQVHHQAAVPNSLRGRRSTMVSSELRNFLDQMRSGGNLRVEDVMLLNRSLVLGAADINDRYRDMRLDVDNMTYEELLSLEERIGDVCTGLNEETISNRLKQKKYTSSNNTSPEEAEEPCCVCQEEYKEGQDMGMLECGHGFHSQCIKEWLKRKNLCPICKTTGLKTLGI